MTRPTVAVGMGFFTSLAVSFVLYGGFYPAYRLAPVAIGFLAVMSLLMKPWLRCKTLAFLAAAAVGAAYFSIYTSVRLKPLEALDGETVEVVGRVVSCTEADASSVIISGKVNGIPAKISVYLNEFSGEPGDLVGFSGVAKRFSDTPFFSSRSYYLPDGVFLSVFPTSDVKVVRSEKPSAINAIRRYSEKISLSIREVVGGDEGEILSAMVTGSGLKSFDGLSRTLSRAGVRHAAAISGVHVSVVAIAMMQLLKRLKTPRLLRTALVEATVVLYVVFSGLRVSAVRAGIMMSLILISGLVRRKIDPLNSICLCGILMTVQNPYAAVDSSLVLSLAGVFGVAVSANSVIDEYGIKTMTGKALIASTCASMTTAPFMAKYFGGISLLSPVANLIILPLFSAALVFGMAFAATGGALNILLYPASVLLKAALWLCGVAAKAEFLYLPLGSTALKLVIGFGAGVVVWVWLLSKNVRMTSKVSAAAVLTVVIMYFAVSIVGANQLRVDVISSDGDAGVMLRKGHECVIIDFSGTLADEFSQVLESMGVNSVRAVIACDRKDSAYSSYADIPIVTDKIYFIGEGYVYGGRVESGNLPENSVVEVLGIKIIIGYDGAVISAKNTVAGISYGGAADGGDLRISLLKGLTVVDSAGSKTVYKGDFSASFLLGVGG